MKKQLNEVKQLQKIAGLIKEDYDETNLEVIVSDIQSHIETSSALKTDFKVSALNMIDGIDESVRLERWEDALMELEDLQLELEQANPAEYEEVFSEMFEKAIRRVEALAAEDEEADSFYDDNYMEEGDLNEAAQIPDNIVKFAKRKGILPLVKKVAAWAEKSGKKIRGGTAIGKNYDTLILDLSYQDGAIYIDIPEETVELYGEPVQDAKSFKNVLDSQDKEQD